MRHAYRQCQVRDHSEIFFHGEERSNPTQNLILQLDLLLICSTFYWDYDGLKNNTVFPFGSYCYWSRSYRSRDNKGPRKGGEGSPSLGKRVSHMHRNIVTKFRSSSRGKLSSSKVAVRIFDMNRSIHRH
jgi:hypothetical protein